MSNIGICENCHKSFSYKLIHNGFNESSYAYCDNCGKTAIFDSYLVPNELKQIYNNNSRHNAISEELEDFIMPCDCSGNYKHNASPRCPHCNEELSAILAEKYIENNAPGVEKGWQWQSNWTGLYAIIIEGKSISNCWKK